ncbi:MAG: HAD family phosphatase [Thermoproteota archaeon]|nr:HAD family phosphatase [Thermoproteota archaeon]
MDGVLLDSMPYHAEAMYQALKLEIDYHLEKKWVFLLEGMPADEFLNEVFKINPPKTIIHREIITKIVNLKKKIFKEIENITLIDGSRELLEDLNKTGCIKAIVSGASRKEAYHIIEKKIGSRNFDLIITADDVINGKPDPQPFTTALRKTNLDRKDALIVENSPLGVISAHHAAIKYIITLNNTPLTIPDFYNFLPSPSIKNEFKKCLFKDTRSTRKFILEWVCK